MLPSEAQTLLLDLCGARIEVCSAAPALLAGLTETYPGGTAARGVPHSRLGIELAQREIVAWTDPPASLEEILPAELDERFQRRGVELLDRHSGIRLRSSGPRLLLDGPAPAAAEVLLFHLMLLAARRAGRDLLVIHGGGAIAAGGKGALLLVGPSGSGKSALAAALCRRGLACVSDEVLVIEGGRVLPYPRAIGLREPPPEPHAARPAASGETKHLVAARSLGAAQAPASAAVACMVVLEPYGPFPRVQPLDCRATAQRALPHCYTGRKDPARLLLRLLDLCGKAACFSVRPGTPEDTAARLQSLVS
ncbi:MAG: hypothetical protein HY812_00550 [Planctomycetes bacterium]|nr:hypothetical protein [Planctomycetota bacterium]